MYVCYGFRIEICKFTHSLRTFLARAAHDTIAMELEIEDSEDRRQPQNKSRWMEDG